MGKQAGRQAAIEYQLAHGALMQTHYRNSMDTWHVQGMYVFTPSGKLLAGGNNPWRVESALDDMRKGLAAYAKLPRAQRLLGRAPDPKKDRMFPEHDRPRPPVDGLVLRVVGRGFEENVAEGCQLAPKHYSLDRLWYTRAEAMQFLPDVLEPGQKKAVTGPVLSALAQLHLIARGSHFHDEDVKELQLTSEVTGATGPTVELRLSGRAVLEADDPWFASKYRPDLLGYLTYDTEKKRFTRFDLLAYGMHNLKPVDMKEGGPEYIPVAFRFTLNGSNVNDDQVPTRFEVYRYVELEAAR